MSQNLAPVLALLLLYLFFKLRAYDRAYLEMNRKDWKINLLPIPSLFVRIFNILVGKFGASLVITLVEKTLIKSALKKSLRQMREAEASGKIPSILCDASAREAMMKRLTNYAEDMRASNSLNPSAKIYHYAGSLLLLSNHAGLLELGMEADDEIVRQPVFIASMPRTATTILHRTMATDESRWRGFDLADMLQPLPPIPRSDRKSRNKLAKKMHNATVVPLRIFYPGWFECVETMDPKVLNELDEDLGLYNSGLGMAYQDTLVHLQSEQKSRRISLENGELASYRYAWLDMIMRIHQKLEPDSDKTWLMKDPKHTAFLPQLIQQFPDARFIFVHRPPSEILASMAKLFVCFTCVAVNPGAPGTTSAEWGQYALEKMKFFLDGVVQYSKTHHMNEDKRIDFLFSELAPDVVGSIERIYDTCFNQKLGEDVKATMRFYVDNHTREKKESQPRSLQDFHLKEQDVAFNEYSEMFL